MEKSVAIVQSSYIPWKGYFDLIASVDEFVLYDDRQFTRRDWRNRNRIKTPQGPAWITVPVETKGRYTQRIDETVIADPDWPEQHLKTLRHNYAAAPYFVDCSEILEELYTATPESRLSSVNRRFLETIAAALGITTPISWSTDYSAHGAKTERLVSLCRATGASMYVSGPTARAYLDESAFQEAGIALVYFDYSGYPEYDQLHPPFEHAVTILDLLVNTGPEARKYLKAFADAPTTVEA